ncbi:site-specific integrase [Thalassobacillus devorans]|uniref:Site-specific integrase n=1 Tax=Thalassobacillus devorans TaxID=279813 RepID=A0ABQ1P1P7_9BACI|nr:site-specific integrase [Thalassobacillus devorans]NIK28055.1 integrase [Thalassobacillus devorans]GGC89229.1 site-specific integrase [Thalassobacillus devorans]
MASYRKRNNKWQYRISHKDPFTQKYIEKSKGGFRTKKEAQLAAAKMEEEIKEGYFHTSVSLKAFLLEWLEVYKKDEVRENTYKLHKYSIEKHILPFFKDLMLDQLNPTRYQKFINELADKGLSKRTIENIHSTMSNAMKKAVILSKIKTNPCIGVTLKGKTKEKEINYLEKEALSQFLQEAYRYGYEYGFFFKILLETGLRKGEAAALQWKDIDLVNGTINVTKTLNFSAKNDTEVFGSPKTKNSKRLITISDGLVEELKKHQLHQKKDKLTCGSMYNHSLNLVHCRKDGSFLRKSSLHNAFRKIKSRANLPDIAIHALRHTHAVLMLEAGVDMKYIQERLGHKSIQITSDIYAHISKKLEDNNFKKYQSYVSSYI